jgi:hypothetical protein
MEKTKEEKSTSEKVFEKIKQGKVKKRSKLYFVLKNVILVILIFLMFLFSMFLGSFILFTLRATGALFLPIFGLLGLRTFIFSFPWFLVVILFGLAILLETSLSKNSSFVYKKPLLYSTIFIVLFVLLGSFAFRKASFHASFLKQAKNNKLPLVGSMYRGYGLKKIKNTCIGVVAEITENGCVIETKEGESLRITFCEKTKFFPKEQIRLGDLVLVFGETKNGNILSFGIKKIENVHNLYFNHIDQKPPKKPILR